MMADVKKRSYSQIIGDQAVAILKSLFPASWVVREYNPDYGIDLSVELFEESGDSYVTTGEHVYFQVKGKEHLKRETIRIYERKNVEKCYEVGSEFRELEVVKHQLDTALLATVEKMGSAVPVLLAVVDVERRDAYFVCLNDYIEKVIVPDNQDYVKQKTMIINIPVRNCLSSTADVKPICWYGKRAKLMALFTKINYQKRELQYIPNESRMESLFHFARILRRLDAWSATEYFYSLHMIREELDLISENTNDMEITQLWEQICNCGDIYEDIAKEWFLPTYLGVITSEL